VRCCEHHYTKIQIQEKKTTFNACGLFKPIVKYLIILTGEKRTNVLILKCGSFGYVNWASRLKRNCTPPNFTPEK